MALSKSDGCGCCDRGRGQQTNTVNNNNYLPSLEPRDDQQGEPGKQSKQEVPDRVTERQTVTQINNVSTDNCETWKNSERG
jgi:hypothetical protein